MARKQHKAARLKSLGGGRSSGRICGLQVDVVGTLYGPEVLVSGVDRQVTLRPGVSEGAPTGDPAFDGACHVAGPPATLRLLFSHRVRAALRSDAVRRAELAEGVLQLALRTAVDVERFVEALGDLRWPAEPRARLVRIAREDPVAEVRLRALLALPPHERPDVAHHGEENAALEGARVGLTLVSATRDRVVWAGRRDGVLVDVVRLRPRVAAVYWDWVLEVSGPGLTVAHTPALEVALRLLGARHPRLELADGRLRSTVSAPVPWAELGPSVDALVALVPRLADPVALLEALLADEVLPTARLPAALALAAVAPALSRAAARTLGDGLGLGVLEAGPSSVVLRRKGAALDLELRWAPDAPTRWTGVARLPRDAAGQGNPALTAALAELGGVPLALLDPALAADVDALDAAWDAESVRLPVPAAPLTASGLLAPLDTVESLAERLWRRIRALPRTLAERLDELDVPTAAVLLPALVELDRRLDWRLPHGVLFRTGGGWLLEVPALPPTLSLGPDSTLTRLTRGQDLQTGDGAFDAAVRLLGPEEVVAGLDAATREQVRRLIELGVTLAEGVLRAPSLVGADLRALVEVAARLPPPDRLDWARLAGEPDPGVRRRLFELLAERGEATPSRLAEACADGALAERAAGLLAAQVAADPGLVAWLEEPVLLRLLDHRPARLPAIAQLAEVGTERALGPLAALGGALAFAGGEVRAAAREAGRRIAERGGPRGGLSIAEEAGGLTLADD